MPYREKVIKEIKAKITYAETTDQIYSDAVRVRLLKDVLELLKDQGAVEPKQVDLYGKDDWYGLVCVCPDCKAEWMSDEENTHFCPNCGMKVKWA